MRRSAVSLAGVILALAAAAAGAGERYGLSTEHPLDLHASAGGAEVLLTLPPHGLYFRVLEETPGPEGWYRIASLPSVRPPYQGWTPRAAVEVFDTARAARLRYFATHPLLTDAGRFISVLEGGYWDLREQGAEVEAQPPPWLRYGFDFGEWYIVRGKTYEAEIYDIADIISVDEGRLVLTVFVPLTATPPERLEIELLRAGQIRILPAFGPAYRFGRSPSQ